MISIVMTCWNKKKQLLNTLASIRYFGNPEIIVIDDGSDEKLNDIPGIKLVQIEKKDKFWLNPCIPNNIGFSLAKGDIIIIQNPESLHTGDILSYVEKLTPRVMFSFGAYSMVDDLPPGLKPAQYRGIALKQPQRCQVNHHGWYNHSIYRPLALHFCNAFLRADLEKIGGFDERYARGVARDDDEIVIRIKRAGMKIQFVDDPFVIHQKHERTDYRALKIPRAINENLFINGTLEETFVKPPKNLYYGVAFKS